MKRVLLIDDEQDFSYFLKNNLEASGKFEVSVCNESQNAIALIRELRPDLVLLDIVMPVVSGTDIAAQMREGEELKNIPFVFLTAIVKSEEVEMNRGCIGGETFIAKPVAINDLVNTINRSIE